MGDLNFNLPPGFQFCPTDEELVIHFLSHKASDTLPYLSIIPELDCHMHNPWELNGKAMSDGDQWYFFSRTMEKEATKKKNGFWKQIDIEEPVFTSTGEEVGNKKFFVFCIDEAMAGTETNWVMVEYSLCNCGMMSSAWFSRRRNRKLDYGKWVLCRVYEKKGKLDRGFCNNNDDGSDLSYLDEVFLSLDDDLDEICSS